MESFIDWRKKSRALDHAVWLLGLASEDRQSRENKHALRSVF